MASSLQRLLQTLAKGFSFGVGCQDRSPGQARASIDDGANSAKCNQTDARTKYAFSTEGSNVIPGGRSIQEHYYLLERIWWLLVDLQMRLPEAGLSALRDITF